MITLKIPSSGRLLTTQLAAYGLALALRAAGHSVWIGHASSLECDPVVETDAAPRDAADCVIQSALLCEPAVEADIVPGATGNDRMPVIYARATDPERAKLALVRRELLLDSAEDEGEDLVAALLAGLGAPAPWLHEDRGAHKPMPSRGATQLDGVGFNIGSDIVRGLLRRALSSTKTTDADALAALLAAGTVSPSEELDRTQWSPAGTKLDPAFQWLAAIGLGLLPVGLTSSGSARTPGFGSLVGSKGLSLPVMKQLVSVPRLRAILQRQELTKADGSREAARLRALDVSDVLTFAVVNDPNPNMRRFSFATASRLAL